MIIEFVNSHKGLRNLLVFLILFYATFSLFSGTASASFASAPRSLPEIPQENLQFINLTNSADATDVGNGSGANLLNSSMKIYAQDSGARSINLDFFERRAGFGQACTGYQIVFAVFRLDGNGSNVGLAHWEAATVSSCDLDRVVSIPAGILTLQNDPSLGGVYAAQLQFTINPYDGGVHTSTFRATADSGARLGYLGAGNFVTKYPSLDCGYGPSAPDACDLTVKFQAPCAFSGKVAVHWKDHDYPTIGPSFNQPDPNLMVYEISPAGTTGIATFNPVPGGYWRMPANTGGVEIQIKAGYKYRVVMRDVSGGNGMAVSYPFDSGDYDLRTCSPPPEVSGDISGDCNVIRIRNVADAQDNGAGNHITIRAYKGSGSGFDPNVLIYDGRFHGNGDFAVPDEDASNSGWRFTLYVYNMKPGPNDAPAFDPSNIYKITAPTGACVSATCQSVTITNGAIPGRPNAVKAGVNFTAQVRFRNNGGALGTADLRPTIGGTPLYASIYNNPPFPDTNSPGGGYPSVVPAGQDYYIDMVIPAPSGIGGPYNAQIFANYLGKLVADTGHCDLTINTYQPFLLEPSANMPVADDLENPTKINFNTRIEQRTAGNVDGSPYTSQPIPATADSRLYYFDQGVLSSPDIKKVNHDGTYGTAPFGDEWTDSPGNDGRNFHKATGETGTWKAGDKICSVISISPSTGWLGPGGDIADPKPGSSPPTNCDIVADHPYFRAYGSDVFAGGQFDTAGSGTNPDIKAYTGDQYTGKGSGVEFAAFAIGSIEGFNTAFNRSASKPLPPLGLAFANTGPDSPGHYTGARSVTNYFDNALEPDTPVSPTNDIPSLNSLGDGKQTYMQAGSTLVKINNGNNFNKHHAIFIEGDVLITDDITYQQNNWTDFEKIPSFRLYVKGNIYISKNVNNLDGLFVAQPKDDGTGGTIYTCSSENSSALLYGSNNLNQECNSKLSVNGAFAAQNIRFLRTFNTTSNAGDLETFGKENSAESFRFSPDLLLSVPAISPDGSQVNGSWDYVATLPPIL